MRVCWTQKSQFNKKKKTVFCQCCPFLNVQTNVKTDLTWNEHSVRCLISYQILHYVWRGYMGPRGGTSGLKIRVFPQLTPFRLARRGGGAFHFVKVEPAFCYDLHNSLECSNNILPRWSKYEENYTLRLLFCFPIAVYLYDLQMSIVYPLSASVAPI